MFLTTKDSLTFYFLPIGICLLENKMQDLTNKMTWDGSYLEKYHFERMLRKSQRKYKRYTRYTQTCAAQHMLLNLAKATVLEVLKRGNCTNLHVTFLTLKPVFSMSVTLTFVISDSL